MEHFREVVAPEIKARQINNSHQCTLGQLVDKVVACLSADKMYRVSAWYSVMVHIVIMVVLLYMYTVENVPMRADT